MAASSTLCSYPACRYSSDEKLALKQCPICLEGYSHHMCQIQFESYHTDKLDEETRRYCYACNLKRLPRVGSLASDGSDCDVVDLFAKTSRSNVHQPAVVSSPPRVALADLLSPSATPGVDNTVQQK
eukprot:scaffold440338_cov44-Prasinocladus_malaysianus.AAC.1